MPLSRTQTKSALSDVIGGPKELSVNELPTRLQVLRYYNFTALEKKLAFHGKDPPAAEVVEVVASKLLEIWNRDSIRQYL